MQCHLLVMLRFVNVHLIIAFIVVSSEEYVQVTLVFFRVSKDIYQTLEMLIKKCLRKIFKKENFLDLETFTGMLYIK